MNELIIIKLFILNKDIYNNTNTTVSSIEDFKALFYNEQPSMRKSEKEAYEAIFSKMIDTDVSDAVIDTLLETHKTRYIASQIAQVAWDTSNGQRTLLELQESFQRGMEEIGKPVVQEDSSQDFVTDDINQLLDNTFTAPGLQFRSVTLRKMMGSLRKGNFGFIFARPNAGKTTLIASECSYFAEQMDSPLLHCNNEEQGFQVKLRYIQASLGMTLADINKNRQKAYDDFMEKTKGNIKLLDRASLTKQEIEDVCRKLNPGLIVIDSIDKVKGFSEDGTVDMVYKKIYQWARELSKTYGPVIGVCHAAASGEGKEWLEMDDVAYAKTAKQGEADWILGIGFSHDNGKEYIRGFHPCKNKLMGDVDFIEEYRHGKVRVQIQPEIARYEDIMFK